jgi:hypothetical protein
MREIDALNDGTLAGKNRFVSAATFVHVHVSFISLNGLCVAGDAREPHHAGEAVC